MPSKKTREWYIANGICPHCGQRELQEGYKLCLICRTEANERRREKRREQGQTPEQLQAQRERNHALRAERKAKGLCPRCGKHKPEAGYVNCKYCRAKTASAKRREYRREGKISQEQRLSGYYCYHCTAELPEWRGSKLCDNCMSKLAGQAEHMRAYIDYANHPYGRQAHEDALTIKRRQNGRELSRIDFKSYIG